MEKRQAIDPKNLPGRPPITLTLLVWIALEHWHAPEWAYGMAITFGVLLWGVALYGLFTEEYVDVFKK